MIEHNKLEFSLARRADAREIAQMSRDLIETGLGWSWTPQRVLRALRDRDTIVLTARIGGRLLGFAIMKFLDAEAHLGLLAVYPAHQRAGVGRRLLAWLEDSARVAGTFDIHLEVRSTRPHAHTFYRALGYHVRDEISGYYQGLESALRMTKNLSVQAA
jgi:ribosomal protein S18 acetylase RimI-like enzyme